LEERLVVLTRPGSVRVDHAGELTAEKLTSRLGGGIAVGHGTGPGHKQPSGAELAALLDHELIRFPSLYRVARDLLPAEPAALAELAAVTARHAPDSGDHLTSIPGVTLSRRHAPTEQIRCIYTFGLTVVEQGSMKVQIGQQICDYRPGQCTLTTIDQPLVSHETGRERSSVAARIALSTERLQRCQRDQAEPRLAHCTVSAIARGAATTSAVSRAFKAKDGISAREHCRKGTVNSAAAWCA